MVYTPPMNIAKRDTSKTSIFLAGSIEMGKAVDWQSDLIEFLEPYDFEIFNPRRDDWDSSWKQSYDDPRFFQQVNWELNALQVSNIIVMNFDPNTLSPISLLETGLFGHTGRIHVVCPDGYWRKGNIDIVCDRYGIPLYDNISQFKEYIQQYYKI